ncbi:flagellar basal body-associated FliL family protein [Amantichitinum ursilacus]|uniref:Flagellar protein FliL n=1 Tax=Amantichitinum ursilacus TaxID=857265 RepID=A0A0N0XGP7_9NEIS|nr:flagellar basal body-associated FliL family protein [Amantichitinum ursilacus]KPC50263.1 flagellar basal body-associated protein FliL [Amantichitinum ursilacus]
MSDAAPAKGKSKVMLFVIIGVVLLIVLIGGGVAAFLMMHNSDSADGADGAGTETQVKEAKAKKEKSKKKDDAPPIFEKLSQFTVNLNSGDTDVMLQTDITVQVADAETQEKLKSYLPQIQGDVNKLLRSKTPEDVRAPDGTDKLGREIRGVINKILGITSDDEGVLSVNFTTFIVQ